MTTLHSASRTLALLLCAAGAVGCRGLWDRPYDGGAADVWTTPPPPRHTTRAAPPPRTDDRYEAAEVAPSPSPLGERVDSVEVVPPPPPEVPSRVAPRAAAASPGSRAPSPSPTAGPAPTVEDRATFDEVNRVRVGRGLRPFRWNDRLFRAAYDHSAEQARHGYMGHGSPDPARDALIDRMRQAGCPQAGQWAEVVAWGYEGPASVTLGWMNSAGHRKILTDPTLEEAAFSRVGDYFTGNFSAPLRRR